MFCPRSITYHDVFRNTGATELYHQKPQIVGQAAHKNIDEGRYSSRQEVLSGIFVYCEQFALLGRIDVFDVATGMLTERKHSVTAVYDGFRYQLYAQYLALQEMGYTVKSMRIHSNKDNKNYPLDLPTEADIDEFTQVIEAMHHYSPLDKYEPNVRKCAHCIYHSLCDLYSEYD